MFFVSLLSSIVKVYYISFKFQRLIVALANALIVITLLMIFFLALLPIYIF